MTKKLMAVLGALALVACGGSGKPWEGEAPPDVDGGWPGRPVPSAGSGPIAAAGSAAVGGSDAAVGGYEAGGSYAVGGTGIAAGGYEAGGSYGVGGTGSAAGGYEAGGSYAVGGTGIAAGGYEAGGGYGVGGTGYGGFESGGTGSQDPLCSQNVVHCFDAAANCYQYSPSSDCDQIVDVCAAMQMACNE